MFTRAFFTTLMVTLLAVGCSSNRPKNGQDAGAEGANGSNNGMTLELNGDSDSNKAGGLQTVFFGFDSSSLDSAAKSTMQSNADFLKSNAKVDIQVEGHCDERGGRQYNLALGERRRADEVRRLGRLWRENFGVYFFGIFIMFIFGWFDAKKNV
jgi:peptidoglycan-associated lipoprotein